MRLASAPSLRASYCFTQSVILSEMKNSVTLLRFPRDLLLCSVPLFVDISFLKLATFWELKISAGLPCQQAQRGAPHRHTAASAEIRNQFQKTWPKEYSALRTPLKIFIAYCKFNIKVSPSVANLLIKNDHNGQHVSTTYDHFQGSPNSHM
jgi:hypothetical protein